MCLIGFSTPNRRGGSCGGLGSNPNTPTKHGSEIGAHVCCMCVDPLCQSVNYLYALQAWIRGSYLCATSVKEAGCLALPTAPCICMVPGLVTALFGGAPPLTMCGDGTSVHCAAVERCLVCQSRPLSTVAGLGCIKQPKRCAIDSLSYSDGRLIQRHERTVCA